MKRRYTSRIDKGPLQATDTAHKPQLLQADVLLPWWITVHFTVPPTAHVAALSTLRTTMHVFERTMVVSTLQ